MIYHKSGSSESQQVIYNLQLPRMISLNAFKCFTNSRTTEDRIYKCIKVHLLYTQLPGKKTLLWEISTKFTTFEENIGNVSANSERKGPDPKLGMRYGGTKIFGKQELIKGTTSVYKLDQIQFQCLLKFSLLLCLLHFP